MSSSWHYFFTRQLPVTVVAMTLVVEGLTLAADAIPFRRHDLDLLAQNVELGGAIPEPGVVVIGDSVTQDIFKSYAIGAADDVANLTTNKANGLVGAYLLLRRYLAHHAPPRYLLIAATPEFYTFHPDGEAARVYLETVFRQPDEVQFLDAYLERQDSSYEPAILHMDERLGAKLLALLAPEPTGLLMGDKIPDPGGQPGSHELSRRIQADITGRGEFSLDIPDANFPILQGFCALADEFDFTIRVQTAPIPETAHTMWMASNRLTQFSSDRDTFFETQCPGAFMAGQDQVLVVPDEAMRDADHLVRHDWTNVYAVLLDKLIRHLP
jgi:hypothetical protein